MRIKTVTLLAACLLALAGCNDNNNSGGGSKTPTAKVGVLGAPPVEGLSYQTTTQSGLTDAKGAFRYLDGEKVSFAIGNILLPDVQAKTALSLTDFGQAGEDQTTRNIRRLLTTLDADGKPENGITITAAEREAAKVSQVDVTQPSDTAFESNAANYLAVVKPANPVLIPLAGGGGNSGQGGGSAGNTGSGGGSTAGGAGDSYTPTTLEPPRRLTLNAAPVDVVIRSDDGAGYVFSAIAGKTYTITVTPKTALDDPDVFVFRTLKDLRSYWAVEAANIPQGAVDSPAATQLRVGMSANETGSVETVVFVAERTGDYFIMVVDTGDIGDSSVSVMEQ